MMLVKWASLIATKDEYICSGSKPQSSSSNNNNNNDSCCYPDLKKTQTRAAVCKCHSLYQDFFRVPFRSVSIALVGATGLELLTLFCLKRDGIKSYIHHHHHVWQREFERELKTTTTLYVSTQ
jgi:hypothetical protein